MKKNKLPYQDDKNFKVPEGYFETLEDRIMDKVTSTREKASPTDHYETGFRVPEGYFDNIEDRLFEKIENKPKSSKLRNLFNKEVLYYIAGAAAVFVALVTTVFTNPTESLNFEDLDIVTLENYLYESLELSNSGVTRYLGEEEAYAAPSSQADIDFEAVYEYLNENVEEPSILFNEN